jgi:uncharacterized SAM-binding protein YcdF (DUF218 family)
MMRRILWALLPAALLLLLGIGFLGFLDATAGTPDAPPRRTDSILVLTGGAGRVETGLALLEAGAAPRLLVSGATEKLTLAELARAHNRDPSALQGRVALGHAAATTMGNAAEAAAWAQATGARSLRVVTAGYHMPRALLELRRALPRAELVPHPVQPVGPGTPWTRRAWLVGGEYVKLIVAATGLSALIPAREGGRR